MCSAENSINNSLHCHQTVIVSEAEAKFSQLWCMKLKMKEESLHHWFQEFYSDHGYVISMRCCRLNWRRLGLLQESNKWNFESKSVSSSKKWLLQSASPRDWSRIGIPVGRMEGDQLLHYHRRRGGGEEVGKLDTGREDLDPPDVWAVVVRMQEESRRRRLY